MTKKKTIVGIEPAEKTQTDGPEGLKTTLPLEPLRAKDDLVALLRALENETTTATYNTAKLIAKLRTRYL